MTEADSETGTGGTSHIERATLDANTNFASENQVGRAFNYRRALENRWDITHTPGTPQVEVPVMMYGYGKEPEASSWKSTSPLKQAAGETPPSLSFEDRARHFAQLQANITKLRSTRDHHEVNAHIAETLKALSDLSDGGIFAVVKGKLKVMGELHPLTFNKDGTRRSLTPEDVNKVQKPEAGYSSLLKNAKPKGDAGHIAIKPEVLRVGTAKFEAPKVAKIEIPKVPLPKAPFIPKLK